MGPNTLAAMRRRIAILFLLVALFFTVLGGRLTWIQAVCGNYYGTLAEDTRTKDFPVMALRGTIADRNGHPLAISVSVDSVYAVPPEISRNRVGQMAQILAGILHRTPGSIEKKLRLKTGFVWVERRITPQQSQEIRNQGLRGIGIVPENRRFYPQGHLASQVIGFSGIDNQGLEGFEAWYDKTLRGKDGGIRIEFDAAGRQIPKTSHQYIPPVDGKSMDLTIDQTIQGIVEREADKALQQYQATRVTIICVDPKTGEVLGMTNKPDYDPNEIRIEDRSLWRNTAVSNIYEPGSTFKIITAAAAMEEKKVSDSDQFFCPGAAVVPGATHPIRCAHTHGSQDFPGIVAQSCNVGFITLGRRLGGTTFQKYIRAFGFGQPTRIDVAGEESGMVRPLAGLKEVDVATNSIGQGIAVTPIQLLMATSAVANGGNLLQPQLVHQVRDSSGKVVRSFKTKTVRRVVSQDTAQHLNRLLENVVSTGTGRNAYIPGYRVAGKTGTAQVARGGGYVPGLYVASFVGFAPANDPKIAMLVVIDEPKSGMYYGGLLAAPAWQAAGKDILQYLQVPIQRTEQKLDPRFIADNEKIGKRVTVPNVLNLVAEDAAIELQAKGLRVGLIQPGSRILTQTPRPGVQVPLDTEIELGYAIKKQSTDSSVTIPNLAGKSLRESADLLGQVGLLLAPEGTGVAIVQQPLNGIRVRPGTVISVKFAQPQESSE